MSRRTAILVAAQIFGPSIIGVLLLTAISVNSRIAISQNGLTNELVYYANVDGYNIESNHPWSSFRDLDGIFLRVSRQGLRQESEKVRNTLGVSWIFVDEGFGVMWTTGFASVKTEVPTMIVYYWTSSPSDSPTAPDPNPSIGTV